MNSINILSKHYKDNKPDLLNRARQRAFDPQDAEDILGDALLKALSYIDSFNPKKDIGAWFYTILNNTIRDYRTDFLKNKAGSSHESAVEFTEVEEELCNEDNSFELYTLDKIRGEIDKKSGNTNIILRMYFYEEYSPKDIAELVDTTSHSVRETIHRFKKEMREKYE